MSLATMTSDLARPRARPVEEGAALEGVAPAAVSPKAESRKAFDALARFIPVEVLAPFIMAVQYASDASNAWTVEVVYWIFVFATPFLLVIFEFARVASSNKPWPDRRHLAWRAIAAGIAFAFWALSVPGSTYHEALGVALTGLMAVSISPILTAVDAIVMRVLRDRNSGQEG